MNRRSSLLTFRNFQDDYNVSRSTIYRLAKRGEIALVHIGRAVRIRREDADRWYASLTGSEAND